MTRSLAHSLHEHGAALRRLAGHLVGMAHAHDLVQDAAVEVLQARGSVDQPVAFVRRVLQHLAGKHHRGLRRRRQREATAREPAAPTSPFAAAAQREAVERLHAALMTLPEPVLGALLLRYFEDLSPPQIAARLNVPLPTVKSRLARGLELLRERLTREDRDWRAGMAVAFGVHGEVAATTAVSVAGVVLMGMTMKVAIAVAAAAVLTWLVWPMAAVPDVVLRPQMALAEQAGGANEVVGDAVGAAGAERVAAITNAVASNPDWPAPATVRGRCVDEFGVPLVGCRVSWNGMRNDEEEYSKWVRTHYDPQWQNPPAQVTGQDGTFEWVVVPHEPLRFLLAVHCPGRVEMRREWNSRSRGDGIEPEAEIALGDIVVPVGCEVEGRVVDTNGQPVVGVTCWLTRSGERVANGVYASAQFAATTDGAGRFGRGEHLPSATYEVGVSNRAIERGGEWRLEGARSWHEVVVAARAEPEPGRVIRGVVVDGFGEPVRGADVVVATPRVRASADCKADGSFEIVLAEGATAEPIEVAAGRRGFEGATARGVAWGTTGLRLQMQRGVDVQLRVCDPTGRAVPEFAAWIAPAASLGGRGTGDGSIAVVGLQPGGIAHFDGVRRGRHVVLVEPRDRERLCTSSLVEVEVVDGSPCVVALQLPRRSTRRVRVVAGEQPVPGAEVQLIEAHDEVGEVEVLPVESYFTARASRGRALLRQAMMTDENGEVILSGPARARFVVRVTGPVCRPASVDGVALDVEHILMVPVNLGASLHVQFLPTGIGKQLVSYARYGDSPLAHGAPMRASVGLFRPAAGRPGPAPAFVGEIDDADRVTLQGVDAGAWVLKWKFHQAQTEDGSVFGYEDLAEVIGLGEGESRQVTLDLSGLVPGTLDVLVLHAGEPVKNAQVRLAGPFDVAVRTDANGRVQWPVRPGAYRIVWPSTSLQTVVVPPGGRAGGTFTLPSLTPR